MLDGNHELEGEHFYAQVQDDKYHTIRKIVPMRKICTDLCVSMVEK